MDGVLLQAGAPARVRDWPARLLVAGAAVALALASVLVQGFAFGVSNNIFHIPYVLRWDALPAYAGDAFYQAMPGFASGVLWLLRGVVTEAALPTVFLALHLAGRIATFLALAWALQPLLPDRRARLAALLLVAAAPAMHGASAVGEHGMLMGYFTHTELAWPFVVLCLGMGVRDRLPAAAAFAGLALCINTFVGLWLAWVVAALLLARHRQGGRREAAATLAAFLLVALPVLAWTAATVLQQAAPQQAFSFREYVRGYYPSHFLLEAASTLAVLNLAAMAGLALAACRYWRWRRWRIVLLALAALLAAGMVLPYLWDQRLLFNLHLLRVDGVMAMACTLLLAATAVRLATAPSHAMRWHAAWLAFGCLGGPWLVVALALAAAAVARDARMRMAAGCVLGAVLAACWLAGVPWLRSHPEAGAALALAAAGLALHGGGAAATRSTSALALAGLAFLLLLGRRYGELGLTITLLAMLAAAWMVLSRHAATETEAAARRYARWLRSAPRVAGLAALLAGVFAVGWAEHRQRVQPDGPADRDWVALAAWFRQQAPAGPVLVPLAPAGVAIDHDFQLNARVPVWVGHKQGAAAMWAPAFHDVWAPRLRAVARLETPAEYLEYARREGIGLFVAERQPGDGPACPASSTTAYANASFAACVLAAPGRTPP